MGVKQERRTDIEGYRNGRIVAVRKDHYETDKAGKRYAIWECKCDCGNTCYIPQHRIVSKRNKCSCGCYKPYRAKRKSSEHGMSRTRIYKSYCSMLARCTNKNDMHYKDYGGRGITVCDEWQGENGFINFYKWSMENGYSDKLTIDRINVNGNYEPNNCRWADKITQANNKRTNVRHEVNGELLQIKEISKKYGIPEVTLRGRMARKGITMQEAVNLGKSNRRKEK